MGLNIDDVLRANDEMTEAIQRVRELHRPEQCGDKDCHHSFCVYCTDLTEMVFVDYPCDTIKLVGQDANN